MEHSRAAEPPGEGKLTRDKFLPANARRLTGIPGSLAEEREKANHRRDFVRGSFCRSDAGSYFRLGLEDEQVGLARLAAFGRLRVARPAFREPGASIQ